MLAFSADMKRAFRRVKVEMNALKQSLHEWVVFLNSNQKKLAARVEQLERRLAELESEKSVEVEL